LEIFSQKQDLASWKEGDARSFMVAPNTYRKQLNITLILQKVICKIFDDAKLAEK